MSSDRVRQCLLDIRDNIVNIRNFIGSMSFDAFASDLKTVYATVRALEIVSEASRFLSDDMKARHAQIDWVAVRDAGNIYRHRYEFVTEQRIWDTATKHLAPLEHAVVAELATLN